MTGGGPITRLDHVERKATKANQKVAILEDRLRNLERAMAALYRELCDVRERVPPLPHDREDGAPR